MHGFRVRHVKEARKKLATDLRDLRDLLEEQPAHDPDVMAARGEVASSYGHLLSALGREVSPADVQEAMALEERGLELLPLVEEVEALELQRKRYTDSWPSVPFPQGRLRRVWYAVWRVLCFIAITCLIDVLSMVGFPVYLGSARVLLAGCHVFLAAGIVSRLFGAVGVEVMSAPLTAAAGALPVTFWGWLSLAIISILAVGIFYCGKDLPARESAVEKLQGMMAENAALQDRLQQAALPASLCEALKAWADLCSATHQRDSKRLIEIQLNWEEHPLRTMWDSARGAVSCYG